MKNDFDIIKYKFKDQIKIIPIADVHCGSINFNLKRWKQFKEYILKEDNIYIVIVGDLIDNQTKNSHSPFNVSVIDGIAMTPFEQKKWLVRELIDSRNNKVSFKPFYQIIATSWLDYGGYALAQQLNPSSFMSQEIILNKNKTKELEIKVK